MTSYRSQEKCSPTHEGSVLKFDTAWDSEECYNKADEEKNSYNRAEIAEQACEGRRLVAHDQSLVSAGLETEGQSIAGNARVGFKEPRPTFFYFLFREVPHGYLMF